jgi:transposase
MTHYVGLDVSQKVTAICIVDDTGRRLWRGQCGSDPEQIALAVRRHAGEDARIGIETGPMTPWLVHELRGRGLEVTCLDARHARAALKPIFDSALPQVIERTRQSAQRRWRGTTCSGLAISRQ